MRFLGIMRTRGISGFLSLRTYIPAAGSASDYGQSERAIDRTTSTDEILAAIYFGSY
jgi:hypothetical protein